MLEKELAKWRAQREVEQKWARAKLGVIEPVVGIGVSLAAPKPIPRELLVAMRKLRAGVYRSIAWHVVAEMPIPQNIIASAGAFMREEIVSRGLEK